MYVSMGENQLAGVVKRWKCYKQVVALLWKRYCLFWCSNNAIIINCCKRSCRTTTFDQRFFVNWMVDIHPLPQSNNASGSACRSQMSLINVKERTKNQWFERMVWNAMPMWCTVEDSLVMTIYFSCVYICNFLVVGFFSGWRWLLRRC